MSHLKSVETSLMTDGKLRIVIPGGSGQMGRMLARHFHAQGHHVSVLTRGPRQEPWDSVYWDGETIGDWTATLEGADVCINLSGRSINCRWTEKNRAELMQSRVRTAELLGEVISQLSEPPRVWMNASAASLYPHSFERDFDEDSAEVGHEDAKKPESWHFAVQLAMEWERAFFTQDTPHTRKIALRTSLLFGAHSGSVFAVMLNLVRARLGGAAGNGRQYVSWMHERDYARAVDFLIRHEEIQGAVNMAAPESLPNSEFMRALRVAWGRGLDVNGIPAPAFGLEIGAFFLRTETELVLKSRRVFPRRLVNAGFEFEFKEWPKAAEQLVREWRGES